MGAFILCEHTKGHICILPTIDSRPLVYLSFAKRLAEAEAFSFAMRLAEDTSNDICKWYISC